MYPKWFLIVSVLKKRWRKFRFLLVYRYFLKFYYGESLKDYPPGVVIRLLLSRLAFVTQLPLLLPDRHFPLHYYGAKMYINLLASPVAMDSSRGKGRVSGAGSRGIHGAWAGAPVAGGAFAIAVDSRDEIPEQIPGRGAPGECRRRGLRLAPGRAQKA